MPFNETIYNQQQSIYGNPNQMNGLLSSAGASYKSSGLYSTGSGFAQMAGAYVNYNLLKTDAANLNIQASNIELQAQERANQLREQFISNVGNYQFGAAQRGVSIGSGSVRQNLEGSAMNLGEDIRKSMKSAELQAEALRYKAKSMKRAAKTQMITGILGGVSSISSGIASYGVGSQLSGLSAKG